MLKQKELRSYSIPIAQLENKHYSYVFEGGDAFFAAFDQHLIEKGQFRAEVTLDKSSTLMMLNFSISGVYELTCDRSLEAFQAPFETRQKQVIKFGEKPEQLTDEIEIIAWETPEINVAPLLFDFIALTVPMKKLHPKFRQQDEDSDADTLVYSSAQTGEQDQKPEDDPRWAALKKLKKS